MSTATDLKSRIDAEMKAAMRGREKVRLGIGQTAPHQALDRADDVARVGQQRLLGGVAHHGRSTGAVKARMERKTTRRLRRKYISLV